MSAVGRRPVEPAVRREMRRIIRKRRAWPLRTRLLVATAFYVVLWAVAAIVLQHLVPTGSNLTFP